MTDSPILSQNLAIAKKAKALPQTLDRIRRLAELEPSAKIVVRRRFRTFLGFNVMEKRPQYKIEDCTHSHARFDLDLLLKRTVNWIEEDLARPKLQVAQRTYPIRMPNTKAQKPAPKTVITVAPPIETSAPEKTGEDVTTPEPTPETIKTVTAGLISQPLGQAPATSAFKAAAPKDPKRFDKARTRYYRPSGLSWKFRCVAADIGLPGKLERVRNSPIVADLQKQAEPGTSIKMYSEVDVTRHPALTYFIAMSNQKLKREVTMGLDDLEKLKDGCWEAMLMKGMLAGSQRKVRGVRIG